MNNISPSARPFYIMTKAAGPACNLACRYCYYLDKASTYRNVMSDELLEQFIKEYIEAQPTPYVLFSWHGGEPMLRPLAFYRRVAELQRKYACGRQIDNSIQTNGTLLTDDWCRFLHDEEWLAGISIDGTAEMHDVYRRERGGAPSHARVMRGVELLNRYGVQWNAMAVVNDFNSRRPAEFYNFFKNIGSPYLQFTPIVERLTSDSIPASVSDKRSLPIAPYSVTPDAWGDFLCSIFDLWYPSDVGKFYVQLFDAVLANCLGAMPGLCTLASECGHAGVMEHNGDVYSCDHFVYPEFRLGNISTDSLADMMNSSAQRDFGAAKRLGLPAVCRRCEYLRLCNGECPKNRFTPSGVNYLCEGYHKFFRHAAPAFDAMAAKICGK